MQTMMDTMEAIASGDESFGQYASEIDSISSSCGIGHSLEDGLNVKYFESVLMDMNTVCSSDEELKLRTSLDEFSECVGKIQIIFLWTKQWECENKALANVS